jgi:hypothetical protein
LFCWVIAAAWWALSIACERPPRLDPEPWLTCVGVAAALFDAEPCAAAVWPGAEVVGALAETAGVEPEPLVVLEERCRVNSSTPASTAAARRAI